MHYYIDKDKLIYVLDDNKFENLLPDGVTEITKSEYDLAVNPSKEKVIADIWLKIKEKRRQKQAGGVKIGTKWFHSDESSRIQQLGLVLLGDDMPENLQWKTLDGSFVTMTPTLAGQILAAVGASDVAIFGVAEAHRTEMAASNSPADYDYSGNWPFVYGD